MVIQIGADKFILRLRKNRQASSVRNNILGRQICDVIVRQNGGEIITRRKRVKWLKQEIDILGKIIGIGAYQLPITAAQYEIQGNVKNIVYRYFDNLYRNA